MQNLEKFPLGLFLTEAVLKDKQVLLALQFLRTYSRLKLTKKSGLQFVPIVLEGINATLNSVEYVSS